MRDSGGAGQAPVTMLLGWICAALVAAMTILMTIQVVGRYVMHNPPGWTEELARVAFVYATFLGAALAVARHAHLGIDLINNALPVRVRAAVQVGWRLVACAVLGVVAYQGYFLVERLSGQPLTSVPVSKGFMFAAVPIGCAITLIYELGRIVHEVRVAAGRDDEGSPGPVPRVEFIVETNKD